MAYPADYGNYFPADKSTYGSNTVPEIWRDETLRYAMGKALFPQWVTYWEDLRGGPGETLHVPLMSQLDHAATTALATGTGITMQSQKSARLDVTVAEYGNGVQLERINVDFSQPNMPSEAMKSLGGDWAWSMNHHAAATMFTSGHTYISLTGASGTKDYVAGGAGRTNPTGTFDRKYLGEVRDIFVSNSNGQIVPQMDIPGYGEFYGFVCHPSDARSIKDDVTWENLQLYNLGGRGIFKSRVGVLEEFVIFETNLGVTAGTALAFGMDAFALAMATPMELFFYPDYMQDANRAQAWKWYSVFNYALAMANVGTHAIKCFANV
ncbi:MAG: hypothetical protein KOO60_10960 [Gemmatimonadales bacterium]|nr:hypothetical protein [Gemmatimonadales bacterium]